MSMSDALAALSETPLTFSEIGWESSAPAAPAAVGTPSILTFSARSSFEGPSDCFRFENRPAASPLATALPLAAGAVVESFLSLPPQPAATRAMAQAARMIGRRMG